MKTYGQNALATLPKPWVVEMPWDPACPHTAFEQQTSGLSIRSCHGRAARQLLLAIQQRASPSLVSKNLKEQTKQHITLFTLLFMNCL